MKLKKIALLAFVLVLLSMPMLGTELAINVNGSAIQDVYPGESIQDAIDSAQPGDTIFVHSGTYYEHVVVGLFNLTLLGEDRSTTIIDGNRTSPWDVVHVIADNVTISGFTIQHSSTYMFSSGIHLDHSFNSSVYDNNIGNNWYGMRLSSSSNCSISDNNIYNNINYGLRMDNSSNCSVSSNNVHDNDGAGIGIEDSPNCYVSGNRAVNNGPSDGISLSPGIGILDSSNSSISGNDASSNTGEGISISYSSNSSIFDNDANNNGLGGIELMICSKSSVFGNNANYNEWDGVAVDQSDDCSVYGNNASHNGGDGIELGYSSNCSVSGNKVAYNEWGIRAWGSDNRISHNNFIGNTVQAVVDTFVNVWDDGYPSGGNYWSDYMDRYPDAEEIGDSGIWDTPYVIDENNQDNYPLMGGDVPEEEVPEEVAIGVKAGDWIEYDFGVAWMKLEFLSVEGTNATVKVTIRVGETEQSDTMTIDVVAGEGSFGGLSGFVIPANRTTGDSIYISGYGDLTIAGETKRTYAGASRTVVYTSVSQGDAQITYYWDKQTGVMVEASVTSGGMTVTAEATKTNMWKAAPSPLWMQWWFWAIVAVGIVALAGAVYFLKKGKPPTSTAPTLPTEGTGQEVKEES